MRFCWECCQDFAEAIAQLAMYPPGREALLQDPSVAEALHQVAAEGWEEEARMHAQAALVALSDRQPDAGHAEQAHGRNKHVMASYQWDAQPVVRRIVNELQARGYVTWFGKCDHCVSLSEASSQSTSPHSLCVCVCVCVCVSVCVLFRPGQHEGQHGRRHVCGCG
jgi:hypothetical protein